MEYYKKKYLKYKKKYLGLQQKGGNKKCYVYSCRDIKFCNVLLPRLYSLTDNAEQIYTPTLNIIFTEFTGDKDTQITKENAIYMFNLMLNDLENLIHRMDILPKDKQQIIEESKYIFEQTITDSKIPINLTFNSIYNYFTRAEQNSSYGTFFNIKYASDEIELLQHLQSGSANPNSNNIWYTELSNILNYFTQLYHTGIYSDPLLIYNKGWLLGNLNENTLRFGYEFQNEDDLYYLLINEQQLEPYCEIVSKIPIPHVFFKTIRVDNKLCPNCSI